MELDRRLFDGKLQSAIVYPKFFPLAPTDQVVNLGCGIGPQVAIYAGRFTHMTCVDLSRERLEQLEVFLAERLVSHYETLCAPVENTGLPSASFDRALCIDIIEHLTDPAALLREVSRLLRPGGRALITIPVMHDVWTSVAKTLRRWCTGQEARGLPLGHPDRHNADLSRHAWLTLLRQSPLHLTAVRATTLFPPLHLYGVPRFWFTVRWVHLVDQLLCSTPGIRRLGQAWMCLLEKPDQETP